MTTVMISAKCIWIRLMDNEPTAIVTFKTEKDEVNVPMPAAKAREFKVGDEYQLTIEPYPYSERLPESIR